MASEPTAILGGVGRSIVQASAHLSETHERFHGQEAGGRRTSPPTGSLEGRNEANPRLAASRTAAPVQG